MTENQDVGAWADPKGLGSGNPLDLPKHRTVMFEATNPRLRLANATRAVLQHSATSVADPEAFARAAELLERAAEILADGPHGRSYHASAEGAVGGATHGFISHSPVTGPLNASMPEIDCAPRPSERSSR
ncbi:MAG: hypothetical protein EBY80_14490 [Actinobacteria bacterium]|nr:hypothetical protein [Actinomycetota bacterium]